MDPALLERYRRETPGADQIIHFNNAGAALPPAPVVQVQQEYLLEEARRGGYEMARIYRKEIRQTYSALARLLHTQRQNIALANNATDAYNRALSSIPFSEGDVLITTFNDYVSNIIAFLQLKARYDLKLMVAPNGPNGAVDPEAVGRMIQAYRPRLVAVTHIPTSSGLIQDVEAIGRHCQDTETYYLVDACQSAGQLDLDVGRIHCDFLSATGRKFLRGPRGTGFLYVSDRALEAGLEPLFLDLHSADWLDPEHYRPKPDATRFELWERNYGLVLGLKAAVEYALEVGLENIAERVQGLAAYLREGLDLIPGLQVTEAGAPLSGITTVKVDGWKALAFQQALEKRGINTSLIYQEGARYDLPLKNADWLSRISVHYYNTEAEVDRLFAVLRELMAHN